MKRNSNFEPFTLELDILLGYFPKAGEVRNRFIAGRGELPNLALSIIPKVKVNLRNFIEMPTGTPKFPNTGRHSKNRLWIHAAFGLAPSGAMQHLPT